MLNLLRNQVLSLTGFSNNAPKHRSIIVYYGFNFNRIKSLQNSKDTRDQYDIETEYLVGMVASFSAYKDLKTYFSAAQLLLNKREDITFLAVGKKTDSMNSRWLVCCSNLENFRLLGEKVVIESLIELMDNEVLSTYTEGISNSILEYMTLGKPVIATSGGRNEIVLDSVTGYLVSPSDPATLDEKVEILLNNTDSRKKIGENGKIRVQELFSIETMSENFIKTYNSLLPDKNLINIFSHFNT